MQQIRIKISHLFPDLSQTPAKENQRPYQWKSSFYFSLLPLLHHEDLYLKAWKQSLKLFVGYYCCLLLSFPPSFLFFNVNNQPTLQYKILSCCIFPTWQTEMQSLSILAVPKPWRVVPLTIQRGTEALRDKLLLCFEKERKAKCSTGLVHWGCKAGINLQRFVLQREQFCLMIRWLTSFTVTEQATYRYQGKEGMRGCTKKDSFVLTLCSKDDYFSCPQFATSM